MVSHDAADGQQRGDDDRVVIFHDVIQPAIMRAGDTLNLAHHRQVDLGDDGDMLMKRLINVLTAGRSLLQKPQVSLDLRRQASIEAAHVATLTKRADDRLRGAQP